MGFHGPLYDGDRFGLVVPKSAGWRRKHGGDIEMAWCSQRVKLAPESLVAPLGEDRDSDLKHPDCFRIATCRKLGQSEEVCGRSSKSFEYAHFFEPNGMPLR
jgi:hypothetical protein